MRFKKGDLLRSKNKRTVPINFKDKHIVIVGGPKEVRLQPTLFNSYYTSRTVYVVYVVEDLDYHEFYSSFINEHFKLDVRPIETISE